MDMSSDKLKLFINLLSGIFVFGINIIINFLLSPFIVENIGVEANGFIALASNFISYIGLLTIALNSMASRFITIEYCNNNFKEANKYYTSVFCGNIIIVLVLLVPTGLFIHNLEKFLNISENLIFDVKLLFLFVFVNFYITTGVPNWSSCFFITNKLYLNSICNMIKDFIRIVLLLLFYSVLTPRVYYVGFIGVIITIIGQLWSMFCKYKITPELHIKKKYYDFNYLKTLVFSGIWNSISKLGTLLLSGVDLLITNLFLGPAQMGILALVKIIPNTMLSLSATISGIFISPLTICYATGTKKEFVNQVKQGMKTSSLILTVIVSGVIVWGYSFFKLWQPTQDANLLYSLSIIACISYAVSNSLQCVFNVFTVTNKLKLNSLILILSGLVTWGIVFLLLKFTDLGIYAIVTTSSIVEISRHFLYTIPYASKCLGIKFTAFYPEVFISIGVIIVHVVLGFILKSIINADTWSILFLDVIIYAIVCMLINIFVLLNKEQKKNIIIGIKKIFKGGNYVK